MNAAMSNFARLMAAGAAVMTISLVAAAEPSTEIPRQFHGAGCNLKYTYARAAKGDAADCVNAKAGRAEDQAYTNDDFIRITGTSVAGSELICDVKAVKTASATEFTFDADCLEGEQGIVSTVTLLLRPGRQIIFDHIYEGRHFIEIYQLREELQ
jgi:hypothetical protein